MKKIDEPDEFETGEFYRSWIRGHYFFGAVYVALEIVFVGILLTAISIHQPLLVLIEFAMMCFLAGQLYKIPSEIRSVKRKQARMLAMIQFSKRAEELVARDANKPTKRGQ